jgi:hypothetical protein
MLMPKNTGKIKASHIISGSNVFRSGKFSESGSELQPTKESFCPGLELVDLRINRVVCQARLPRMDKSSSILMLHNHQSFIQVKFMPSGLLTIPGI